MLQILGLNILTFKSGEIFKLWWKLCNKSGWGKYRDV